MKTKSAIVIRIIIHLIYNVQKGDSEIEASIRSTKVFHKNVGEVFIKVGT